MIRELDKISEKALLDARHAIGLYSINELRYIFAEKGKPMSRYSIDMMLNTGNLKYISPNNRNRFIYLKDFLEIISLENKKAIETNPTKNDSIATNQSVY